MKQKFFTNGLLISLGLAIAPVSFAYGNESPKVELLSSAVNSKGETLLTDSFQKTLYIFDLDLGQKSPRCSGDCALLWPPYLVSEEENQTLKAPLGTIARPGGQLQLTYDGHPVYTYIYDRAIGDNKGDDLGEVWHDIHKGE